MTDLSHKIVLWNWPPKRLFIVVNMLYITALCEEGMELDNETMRCLECPIGYYKNVSANDSSASIQERFWCKQCDPYLTTYDFGTMDLSGCIGNSNYRTIKECYKLSVLHLSINLFKLTLWVPVCPFTGLSVVFMVRWIFSFLFTSSDPTITYEVPFGRGLQWPETNLLNQMLRLWTLFVKSFSELWFINP